MKVIAIKSTKKILKGCSYTVSSLYNDGTNQVWFEGKLHIKGIGRFSVNNFTTEDNKPLPKVNIIEKVEQRKPFEFSDIKKGDILICKTDSYTTLVKDAMYKIEDLSTKTQLKTRWNGSQYTYNENYIKFEGVSRKLIFNNFRFEKLPSDQTREITLNKVLYDEDDDIVRTDFKSNRKIDFIKNKELELMKVLSRSLLDENRHHLNIIDWGCIQINKNLKLVNDDYSELLNMKLVDILELIESQK
jgi:hypothetical protein